MPNRVVSIYERVNGNRKPTWRAVEIPKRKAANGGIYLKDNLTGHFYIILHLPQVCVSRRSES